MLPQLSAVSLGPRLTLSSPCLRSHTVCLRPLIIRTRNMRADVFITSNNKYLRANSRRNQADMKAELQRASGYREDAIKNTDEIILVTRPVPVLIRN